jgi:ketosteroid isomerase-like protein
MTVREDETAVTAADDERIRSTLTADIDALRSLYTEDLVYVHASGIQDSLDSLLAKMKDGPVRYRDLRREQARVRVFGDTAVMNGSFTADVIMNGEGRSFTASFTSVWLRSGTQWVMMAWQATSVRKT